jgi:hypothetical protein
LKTPLRPSFIHHAQLNEQVRLQSCTKNPSIRPKMPLSAYLAHVSLVALLVSSGFHLPTAAAQDVCTTQDQPNPIFSQYPGNATGALNTTLAIIPIPMAMARQIIPQQYAILEHAYRALMPDFPVDMYPALVQAGHDHDIRFQNSGIPDFSVRKTHRTLVAQPCY